MTFDSKSAALDAVYGQWPISWKPFFRLRPGKTSMASMHGTHDA